MNFLVASQLAVGLLGLPLVTAFGAWALNRFSKERRLLLEVERRSQIYPNLPEGPAKVEYADRLNDSVRALNARLDPVFKKERRRKRTVIVWIGVGSIATTTVGIVLSLPAEPYGTGAGLALGAVMIGAFLFIERDTKKQRLALRQAHLPDSSLPA
jgi:hypothetical protein